MVCKAVRIAHLDFEAVASVASAVTAVHSGARAAGPVTGRGVKQGRWRGRARRGAVVGVGGQQAHSALATVPHSGFK